MKHDKFDQLRVRTLAVDFKVDTGSFDALNSTELVHELSVYHAELLAQFEDLESAKTELEQRLLENRALFTGAPIAQIVTTAQGDIEQANQLAQALMMTHGVRVGDRFSALYPADGADILFWIAHPERTKSKTVKFTKHVWHQLHVASYSEDRLLVMVTDTTELVESRANYQRALSELSREKSKLMQSLSVVAHEFKTPMWSLQMMLREQKVSEQMPFGPAITSSAEHIRNVLDDLQFILQPDTPLESVWRSDTPYSIAERAITSLKFMLEKSGTRVSLKGDQYSANPCILPAQAFRQVLTHLLMVASDRTHGAEVKIHVGVDGKANNGGKVRLRIFEGNPSRSNAIRQEVLSAFQRDLKGSTEFDLGIQVSKEVALKYGGRLMLSPDPAGGWVFTLELPVGKPNEKASDNTRNHKLLLDKHVLVVDDDKLQQMLIVRYLQSLGATVAAANDGESALSLLENRVFDLLVTDFHMPGLDGLQLVDQLRAKGNHTDIIVVTGGVDTEKRAAFHKLGVLDVLIKPVKVFDFIEVLSRHPFGP